MGTMYVEFKINSVTYNTTKGRKNMIFFSIIGIFAAANLAELFQRDPLYGKMWNSKFENHKPPAELRRWLLSDVTKNMSAPTSYTGIILEVIRSEK